MSVLTTRTIRYGFRETGIWPVNSDKGLAKLGLSTDDNDLPEMPGVDSNPKTYRGLEFSKTKLPSGDFPSSVVQWCELILALPDRINLHIRVGS
jgi:hypothetical protein